MINGSFVNFAGSFLQYLIIMIILAAVAVLGAFVGKIIRDAKDKADAKKALLEKESEAHEEQINI